MKSRNDLDVPQVEDRFIPLPTAKRNLVKEKVKEIQDLLREMVDALGQLKALRKDALKNIVKNLDRVFVKFQASSKDKAAFDTLRSDNKKILTEGKKVLSNMKDPLVTRLYNSLIHVCQIFFGWLDKLQSTVRKTPMLADDPQRARWFVKAETPVQTAKEQLHEAFGKLDAALKEAHEVVNEIKTKTDEYYPTPGSPLGK